MKTILQLIFNAFVHGWFRTGDLGYLDEDGIFSLPAGSRNHQPRWRKNLAG
jgi:acyl-CoA synthetase (AMP-forming)/AMP-acid ligase II